MSVRIYGGKNGMDISINGRPCVGMDTRTHIAFRVRLKIGVTQWHETGLPPTVTVEATMCPICHGNAA